MGLTFVKAKIGAKSSLTIDLELLVDSGASYTVLPEKIWKKLKLKLKDSMDFILADGTKISRGISECYISIDGRDGHTPVVLGEKSDEPLLGVITLEVLGLVLNPFNRSLLPMKLFMAQHIKRA